MKFLRFLFFICVAAVSGNVCAQSQRELGQLMCERNEFYFTLTVNQPTEIQAISELCSVDGTDGRTVVCYANQQQYDRLLHAGYQPNLQTPPSLREEARMWEGGDRATYEWDSYPTYEQYESMMQGFGIIKRDRVCSYIELGTLSSGRKIMGIRINNGHPEGKPKFLYTSTIHGDETTGWILMLRLIDEFCTSTDSRILNLIDNLDIFIFPNTNPDGTYHNGNSSVSGATRANGNGVDMNRNYPDPHGSAHPDGNAYQTETQWFMQFAQDYPFVMAANFHGGAEVMNYPWDNTYTRHADDAWWQYISREYANLVHAVSSTYMTDEDNGITNGADWYTIGGGRQDYMNGYCQCREITIECSSTKNPSASQLPTFWNYNHNALLAYMEQCLNGVHGFVYDTNNQPLDGVTVTVLNHDDEYSIVSTHEYGDFHRPIKGGNYTFSFTKEGYCTEQVNVSITDGQRVNLEVLLTPEGDCGVSPVVSNCYEQVTPSAAGDFVMGYLNESNLVMPTHNSNSTVNATSVEVTATDNGFSIDTETTVPQVTLTAYSQGQYYISYNGRYLAKSNNGSNLTWGTNTSQNGRWHIDTNGIYVSASSGGWGGSTTNYYLYYNNGSFQLSTNAQNNITFYVQGECPAPPTYTINASSNPSEGGIITGTGDYAEGETCTLTATANEGYSFINWTEDGVEVSTKTTYSFDVTEERTLVANFEEVSITVVTQTTNFVSGWNWWTPNVEITLAELESALGSYGLTIKSQDGGTLVYHSVYGWGGSNDFTTLEIGKMYKIEMNGSHTISFEGQAIDPATYGITLTPGNNWIGFFGTQSMTVGEALVNLTATAGDVISDQDGKSTVYHATYGWGGDLTTFEPGKAYIYNSKDSVEKTFYYPSSMK